MSYCHPLCLLSLWCCQESHIRWLLKGPHTTQMGRLSDSLRAVVRGKLALSSWEISKIAPPAAPSGVVSGVGILEVLLG